MNKLFLLILCILFVSCDSKNKQEIESSRPYFGEIEQAENEFVESQIELIKIRENDSI
jgi:hypothetical protein|tara:strand:- start:928 stop:1101 length:174 start_codon:yes stop_codon:yes gene_type:complete